MHSHRIPYPVSSIQASQYSRRSSSYIADEQRSDVLDGLLAALLVRKRGGGRGLPDDALAVLLVREVTVEVVDVSGRDNW